MAGGCWGEVGGHLEFILGDWAQLGGRLGEGWEGALGIWGGHRNLPWRPFAPLAGGAWGRLRVSGRDLTLVLGLGGGEGLGGGRVGRGRGWGWGGSLWNGSSATLPAPGCGRGEGWGVLLGRWSG